MHIHSRQTLSVERAIFLVAKSNRTWERQAWNFCFVVLLSSPVGVTSMKSCAVKMTARLFTRLIFWMLATASSNRPCETSHLGDSSIFMTKTRMMARTREKPPMRIREYRQPMLSEFRQVSNVALCGQEKFVMRGQACLLSDKVNLPISGARRATYQRNRQLRCQIPTRGQVQ